MLNDLHLILSESVEFLMRKTSGCNVGETPSMEFSKQTHFVQQVWVTALQNHPGNNSTLVLLKAPLGCTQGAPAASLLPQEHWEQLFQAMDVGGCRSMVVPSPPLQPFLCRRCSTSHHEHNTDRHQPDLRRKIHGKYPKHPLNP